MDSLKIGKARGKYSYLPEGSKIYSIDGVMVVKLEKKY